MVTLFQRQRNRNSSFCIPITPQINRSLSKDARSWRSLTKQHHHPSSIRSHINKHLITSMPLTKLNIRIINSSYHGNNKLEETIINLFLRNRNGLRQTLRPSTSSVPHRPFPRFGQRLSSFYWNYVHKKPVPSFWYLDFPNLPQSKQKKTLKLNNS